MAFGQVNVTGGVDEAALEAKADKVDPVLSGKMSLGRKENTEAGEHSVAVGYDLIGRGDYSFTEGTQNVNLAYNGHVEGNCNMAVHGYWLLKISEYDLDEKSLTFDTAFPNYSTAVAKLAPDMKLMTYSPSGQKPERHHLTVVSVNKEAGKVFVQEAFTRNYVRNPSYIALSETDIKSYVYSPHVEGIGCAVTGDCAHAEGNTTFAGKKCAHAEGDGTTASGESSHAEGCRSTASGSYSHAEGSGTEASGPYSHAEGGGKATKSYAHAEGNGTTASGENSHAEGRNSIASSLSSHAEGNTTEASGENAHAEGYYSKATGANSHAEGASHTVSGWSSHAEGFANTASGRASHAGGERTIAAANHQYAIGTCNVESTAESDKLIVGKGSGDTARANCFRVTDTGVYATGAHNTTGADYAELFEWADGNPDKEDRVGRFVTLDGEKIRLAGPGDAYLLGIISGNPSVVGDVHDDQWQGMYLYDIFGRPIWEDVEIPDEIIGEPNPENPEDMTNCIIIPAHTEHRQKLNPNYDGTQKYVPRSQRPEWAAVGMMGKLVMVDDGTCQINGWCAPGADGIATASEAQTKFRVMARLDETHIRVLALPQ